MSDGFFVYSIHRELVNSLILSMIGEWLLTKTRGREEPITRISLTRSEDRAEIRLVDFSVTMRETTLRKSISLKKTAIASL